ncbi:hypothetical protein ACMU_06145 [Actibacterium mucosum KCTC 23349]|uniref:Uncharacterized protein n=1 Tax=Actibacterium mucosum KCTC 23349 TaxID=1454373 RepID=A0A037ZJB4_9RHOB|nr:hypothetical protein [Actibacterium mucosum]KAJ56520.1 hypothetical protein ACMU_06145 [Actibacterium mucosum KCTC 23349]
MRCFIISPIGAEDSPSRQVGDDFFNLLMVPALRGYKFEPIRADKISKSSQITEEIVELIQNSELCIADLTMQNPNVFYEVGRRHETGRPIILLARKGENVPFDLAGNRIIFYDLSNAKSTIETINYICSFIDELTATGQILGSSKNATLSTILVEVEKVHTLLKGGLQKIARPDHQVGAPRSQRVKDIELLKMPPAHAFITALESGDIEGARSVLPRVKEFLGKEQYLSALASLAEVGDSDAKDELVSQFMELAESASESSVLVILAGLRDYFTNTSQLEPGLEVFRDLLSHYQGSGAGNVSVLSNIFNRLQQLSFSNNDFLDALQYALEAVRLSPDDDSYTYNAYLIERELGNTEEAVQYAQRFLELTEDMESRFAVLAKEYLAIEGAA